MSVFHVVLSWVTLFLLVLIFTSFLGYCLYLKHVHMKYDHIPGPPRESFFFGHSSTFVRALTKGEVVYDTFLEWAEHHGPVCRLNVLHYVLLLVTCPEGTKEILLSPKYPKDKFFYSKVFSLFGQRQNFVVSCSSKVELVVREIRGPILLVEVSMGKIPKYSFYWPSGGDSSGCKKFLGNGLVTAQDHDLWYKQRRIMDPAFSSLYLRGLMGTFNERAEKLMSKLTDVADNQSEASMLRLINSLTLDVIAKVAFGVDLDQLKDRSLFPKAVETSLKGMVCYVRDSFFQFKPKNRPFIKEVREACRLLRTTGAQWIQDRKTALLNGDNVPKDILTQIIKTAGKEESMTKEDEETMLDNFVTFFVAGHETTANQLACCIMELTRRPDILEKVKKEVDDIIGMKQEISYDDLGKLIYLSQVLKETLRVYPPAPGTSRDVLEDIVIDGIHIPGGVTCFFSTYVTGRMDRFFKDPLTFDPDRFHPDAPKPYYCYFPFALGPRSCLGKNFAQMEAKVVMAKLLQRFDFTLLPGQSFGLVDNGTLRPKSGVVCSVKHRNPTGLLSSSD